MYYFEKIPIEQLDEIEYKRFIDKRIFTTLPWIKFIAEDQKAEPVFVRITKNGIFRGYFTGLMIKKFGVKILGSPLKGWSTSFMGFDTFNKLEKTKILPEFVKYAFRCLKCHYIELIDRDISIEEAKKTGIAFYKIDSLELDISKTEDEIFKNFKTDARNFCRQFTRKGAKIVKCTPNDSFAEEFLKQLQDVFSKQKLSPNWSLNKIRRLLRNLLVEDMILCLNALDPSGKSIATGIFPGYNKEFYFWGGASYRNFQFYRPNEAIQWYAIKHWKNTGAICYNMVGVRDYKKKFGPSKICYPCFTIAKHPLLLVLRYLAETLIFVFFRAKGRFIKISKLFTKK